MEKVRSLVLQRNAQGSGDRGCDATGQAGRGPQEGAEVHCVQAHAVILFPVNSLIIFPVTCYRVEREHEEQVDNEAEESSEDEAAGELAKRGLSKLGSENNRSESDLSGTGLSQVSNFSSMESLNTLDLQSMGTSLEYALIIIHLNGDLEF